MKISSKLWVLAAWLMMALSVHAQVAGEKDDEQEKADSIVSVNQSISQDSNFVGFNTHAIKMMARLISASVTNG